MDRKKIVADYATCSGVSDSLEYSIPWNDR